MRADAGYSKRLSLKSIRDAFRLFSRFNSYLLRHWKIEVWLVGFEVISMLLSLAAPFLAKIILDNGILGKDLTLFLKMTVISGIVYLLRLAAEKNNFLLKGYVARRIRVDLARKVLRKTGSVSLKGFQSSSVSDCVSKLNSDIASSSNIIAATLPELIKASLRMIFIAVIIFFIDKRILLIIAAYQTIVLAQANFFTRRSEAIVSAAYAKTREMAEILTQVFSQLYLVKASGKMAAMMRRYFSAFAGNLRLEVKASRNEFASGMLSDLSDKIFFGVVGFVGTLMVIKGNLTLGSLTAIMAYMSQGSAAYASFINFLERIILNRLPLERVAALLDAEIDIKEREGAVEMDLSGASVEFKDVSFEYTSGRRVLDRLSFIVSANDKIALVGSSGCGKTTMINLILRLYDADGGKVLLNGCDVRDMKFKSIYDSIALVPQSPFISGDSIKNVIAYGASKITDEAIIRAAKLSEIHAFIGTLSEGYDTAAGGMVSTLSHGQKQRIAIARALAKDPKILILDEACSSLDSRTEDKIIDNILGALPSITLIVVTHRLSTVNKMNKVYFLKSSGVMSVFTPDRMLEEDPEYGQLFASQICQTGA